MLNIISSVHVQCLSESDHTRNQTGNTLLSEDGCFSEFNLIYVEFLMRPAQCPLPPSDRMRLGSVNFAVAM